MRLTKIIHLIHYYSLVICSLLYILCCIVSQILIYSDETISLNQKNEMFVFYVLPVICLIPKIT